ncbi:MAG TPA: type II toxin-antitoxin system VapB family antitoxin [Acidobacteriaceae bacterium]|nr:type II toxin-antitoxin system VapB family antitoxin [Acidobacteriaceae bacterium]
MSQLTKTRVFMSGRSQHVTIPAEFRFKTNEVYICRDPKTGNLILSPVPRNWDEIFAELDRVGVPDDFLSPEERAQTPPQEREDL